ncbi:mucin-5AC-like [Argiope bruennichi]|uniref:mucin-5AC-like n=1 Tax=Argiope bruennichi TaxID=94029 RepID=UPI002494F2AA|nr:mucin-5AC-like [Argiope bruennichi]
MDIWNVDDVEEFYLVEAQHSRLNSGVAFPYPSDETSYTMVETSVGGSCRCQEEYSSEGDPPTKGCCSPQVFTSVLLGILACVLMTGGVFLAFHRWDPLWLIVSGVGVLLVLIGSILHCCGNEQGTRRPSGGGGKSRPIQSDHPIHGHPIANNGSLTEQLLPLSNARSVSQLSLNMLPGYFPPVVTTYGIEQHSAVVQNINRIVQQQQQPLNPGSISPGVASGAGKSFILLSLPADSTPANIQNLVATVYQLDGSTVTESPSADASSPASPVTPPRPTTPAPLVLKNAEVQTCNIWPNPALNPVPVPSNQLVQTAAASSSVQTAPPLNGPSTSTVSCMAQTDSLNPPAAEIVNLMDCSSDIPSICDNAQNTNINTSTSQNTNIPLSNPSPVLVDVCTSSTEGATTLLQSPLMEAIPESTSTNLLDLPTPTTDVLIPVDDNVIVNNSVGIAATTNVLVDISDNTHEMGTNGSAVHLPEAVVNEVPMYSPSPSNTISESNDDSRHIVQLMAGSSTGNDSRNTVQSVPGSSTTDANQPPMGTGNSDLSLSCDNLSDLDGEVDDEELLGRSSPPPSYDDVAHEGENAIGAFGLAYGTI